MLEFSEVFLKVFPVPKTLGAHTAKRQVSCAANVKVVAASAGEVFSTSGAVLEKNHFVAEDVCYGVDYLFDVVVAFD